jgi:hypothetical protein
MFQTEHDAYVTIFVVDTDGRVRVLFPREPWEDNLARSRRVYEVADTWGFSGFRADAYPGQGYLFAVASPDPFIYDQFESEEGWNSELIADGGRIRGDPYAALTDLASHIVSDGSGDWDYDITPYFVQRHYDYPRFLCYDCHTSVGFQTWNPYDYTCPRFRVVVYDDAFYYPYRRYGAGVVYKRPLRLEPRFIFRDRGASDPFITRVGARPVNDDRRREVGVRGRDIGRSGTVPPPRAMTPPRRDNGAFERSRDRARQVDRTIRGEGQRSRDNARPRPQEPSRRPDTSRGTRRTPPAAQPARPRQPPRAEPSRGGQHDGGKRGEPELRRRKPS